MCGILLEARTCEDRWRERRTFLLARAGKLFLKPVYTEQKWTRHWTKRCKPPTKLDILICLKIWNLLLVVQFYALLVASSGLRLSYLRYPKCIPNIKSRYVKVSPGRDIHALCRIQNFNLNSFICIHFNISFAETVGNFYKKIYSCHLFFFINLPNDHCFMI